MWHVANLMPIEKTVMASIQFLERKDTFKTHSLRSYFGPEVIEARGGHPQNILQTWKSSDGRATSFNIVAVK